MITLIAAAALAAQPAPMAHAPAQQIPMQHARHEAMKKDCCDCCKDMEAGHDASDHAGHSAH